MRKITFIVTGHNLDELEHAAEDVLDALLANRPQERPTYDLLIRPKVHVFTRQAPALWEAGVAAEVPE